MEQFANGFIYPSFDKNDTVDLIHNQKIADGYRWLEDPDFGRTKEFVKKQNDITFPFLKKCQYRESIQEKLTQVWDFPTYSCMSKHGDFFYYYYNSGLLNQSVMYRMRTVDGKGECFLDPNTWSEDGTVALKYISFSKDGKFVAYGQSESGHDWTLFKFMNTETMEMLPDQLDRIKFSSVSWTHDNKGVFYSGFPEQEGRTDGTETTSNLNHKLRYHRMGTSQDQDVLCYDTPHQPKWLLTGDVSECGNYIMLFINQGTDPKVLVYLCDLHSILFQVTGRLDFQPLVGEFVAKYDYIDNEGTRFLFLTNKEAPMQKIVEVDIKDLSRLQWKDLVPTQESVLLNWASATNGSVLAVCYQRDVIDTITLHCLRSGKPLRELPFPPGSISGFFGEKDLSQMFLKFTSYLEPGISYILDLAKGMDTELQILQRAVVTGVDLDNFQMKQTFYSSKDGTKIPMFIMHHKKLQLSGDNPCRLYGYGGFDISIKPGFSVTPLVLMQNLGFVCAVANIRGGGEYGEAWHNGGRLANKQNCFDDFKAAAQFLVAEKYTSHDKLVIEGGSNGGLLVAACMNQNPELFGVVLCHVGVLDMLRFHKFTIGHAWTSDFGDPDKADEFEVIMKYSPLHNVREAAYPACLILSADHDDRVVPLHSLKYLARLQELAGPHSCCPLLARFDVKSGHGHGKPTAKRIEECCDILCFVQLVLNLDWST